MAKIISVALVLILCLLPASALAAGTEVTSGDLIDHARDYDGREVVFSGEVIGDIMVRGGHTWINVSDGNNSAIGVWAETGDMEGIGLAGRYDTRGDIVRVTGVFHRACAEHGGDLDIHADKVELVRKGYGISHPVDTLKVAVAVALFAAAVFAGFFIRRKIQVFG